jgi:kinesin family protein 6/9
VKDENEALNLLFSGELARTTAQHKLNRKSNRSHSIFTVYVQQRQRSGVSERVTHSKLHLVDLAGSERLKKTMDNDSEDTTRRESMAINQSLTYLEQCVMKLAAKSAHIPYRQSKLTNILKDTLGANCKTVMIACIYGEDAHLEESVSTLKLASRMMRVQNETSTVETIDSAALIRKQARIIKALKQELLMHDALVERTGVTYEPYTPEQQQQMAQMLERYVEAPEAEEEDTMNIDSFRQMLEVCKQFKKMLLHSRAETQNAHDMAMAGGGMDATGRPMTAQEYEAGGGMEDTRIADEFDPTKSPFVGESADSGGAGGFSLGTAQQDSRPIGGVEGSSKFDGNKSRQQPHSPSGTIKSMGGGSPSMGSVGGPAFDAGPGSPMGAVHGGSATQAMFEAYAKSDGADTYEEFSRAKAELKEVRQRSRELTSSINAAKVDIDRLQADIASRKTSRIELLTKSGLRSSETEEIVDEEEFRLMKELREAKRKYKNGYERLQKVKGSIQEAQMRVARIKDDLASGFLVRSQQENTFGDTEMMAGPTDQLDDQEAFDRLETQRVMDTDPDSLAFFHANKTKRALLTQNASTIKSLQKTKRR